MTTNQNTISKTEAFMIKEAGWRVHELDNRKLYRRSHEEDKTVYRLHGILEFFGAEQDAMKIRVFDMTKRIGKEYFFRIPQIEEQVSTDTLDQPISIFDYDNSYLFDELTKQGKPTDDISVTIDLWSVENYILSGFENLLVVCATDSYNKIIYDIQVCERDGKPRKNKTYEDLKPFLRK